MISIIFALIFGATPVIIDLDGKTSEIASSYFKNLIEENGSTLVITNGELKSCDENHKDLELPSSEITLAPGVIWSGTKLSIGAQEGADVTLVLDGATMNFTGNIGICRDVDNVDGDNQKDSSFKLLAKNDALIKCNSILASSRTAETPKGSILVDVNASTLETGYIYGDRACSNICYRFTSAIIDHLDRGIGKRSSTNMSAEFYGSNTIYVITSCNTIPPSGTGKIFVDYGDGAQSDANFMDNSEEFNSRFSAKSPAPVGFASSSITGTTEWAAANLPAGRQYHYLAPNGLTYWMDYLMGLDPNDPKAVLLINTTQSPKPEKMRFIATSGSNPSNQLTTVETQAVKPLFTLLSSTSVSGPFEPHDAESESLTDTESTYFYVPVTNMPKRMFFKLKVDFK